MMSRSPARPTATALTQPSRPTSKAPMGAPVTASQTRTVSSPEPDTMMSRSPARPIATVSTESSWPASGAPMAAPQPRPGTRLDVPQTTGTSPEHPLAAGRTYQRHRRQRGPVVGEDRRDGGAGGVQLPPTRARASRVPDRCAQHAPVTSATPPVGSVWTLARFGRKLRLTSFGDVSDASFFRR